MRMIVLRIWPSRPSFLRLGESSFFREARKIFLDALQAFVDNLRADFAHDGGKSGLRRDLRDSGAHQATPYYANFLNRHALPL